MKFLTNRALQFNNAPSKIPFIIMTPLACTSHENLVNNSKNKNSQRAVI